MTYIFDVRIVQRCLYGSLINQRIGMESHQREWVDSIFLMQNRVIPFVKIAEILLISGLE